MLYHQIEKIASERSHPCVTISMNTHRTHPDNLQDVIVLKHLIKEAQDRVISEFGKRPANDLLEKIESIEKEIDPNNQLDSIHIFLSDTTQEIIKSPWAVAENVVHIGESFSIQPLIRLLNRTENYLILMFSQSEAKIFKALNDSILEEIKNDDFPFTKSTIEVTHNFPSGDAKHIDSPINEFYNSMDKSVVKLCNETHLKCVVICTEDNYSRLLKVADSPSIYIGHSNVNDHTCANHIIAAEAWQVISGLQDKRSTDAISEMQEAVSQGNVITDLNEIYRAVKEGRGDLLIAHQDFQQKVKMTGDYSFDLVGKDINESNVIDDITSEIAWEVISKKGRAIFTDQEEIKSLGEIALKVRY